MPAGTTKRVIDRAQCGNDRRSVDEMERCRLQRAYWQRLRQCGALKSDRRDRTWRGSRAFGSHLDNKTKRGAVRRLSAPVVVSASARNLI